MLSCFVQMVSDNRDIAKQSDANTEGKLRRRNGVISRIRTMRSNAQMRSQPVPPELEQPKLCRMKTLTSLSSRSDSFSALKGKSLETLARLGGHSFLELPKDFVPALLKLPVCFAATAGYLRCQCGQPSLHQTRSVLSLTVEVSDESYQYTEPLFRSWRHQSRGPHI